MPSSWDLLQQVFTVETIMTPWAEMAYRLESDDRAEIHDFAERERFDLIPIVRGRDVVGLYRWKVRLEEPLTDRWLVPHDMSIPDLLTHFEENNENSLLVSGQEGVVGIVTLADLNKMPARMFFFNAIAELEVVLARGIRKHYEGKHEELIDFVNDEQRRAELVSNYHDMIEGDREVDLVEFLMLSDLVNIVHGTDRLRSKLGFRSKKQVEKLNGLVHFRNDVMHSVRPVLKHGVKVGSLAEHVKRSRGVSAQITEALDNDETTRQRKR